MKFSWWMALVLVMAGACHCDAQVYSSGGPVVNNAGQAIAANIAVCTSTPPGTHPPDCGSYVATYTDATLSVACTLSPTTLGPIGGIGCTNPGKTDSRGNFTIYAFPAIAVAEIYGYGVVTFPQIITIPSIFAASNGVIVLSPASDVGAQINAGILAGAKNFQAACGGSVFTFSTPIVVDNTVNVSISGCGGLSGGAQAATEFLYTSAVSPIVSAKSTTGFRWDNIQLVANNAAFNGIGIDLQHSGAATDSALDEIDHSGFFGTGGAKYSIVASFDKTIASSFHNNTLHNYAAGYSGAPISGHYSNGNASWSNHYGDSTGTTITAHIQDPGAGFSSKDDIFEMGSAAGNAHPFYCSNASLNGAGLTIINATYTDDNSTATNYITNCLGTYVGGNYSANTTNTTIFNMVSAGPGALVVIDGDMSGGLVNYALGSAVQTVDIDATTLNSVTTFLTGTPYSGRVWDGTAWSFYGTDLWKGTNNIFENGLTLRTFTDVPQYLAMLCGNTIDVMCGIQFQDFHGSNWWQIVKGSTNHFNLLDLAGVLRFDFINNAGSVISSGTGASVITLNGSANSGTGGTVFGSGGASPTTVGSVDGSGNAKFNGTVIAGSGPTTLTDSVGHILGAALPTTGLTTTVVVPCGTLTFTNGLLTNKGTC